MIIRKLVRCGTWDNVIETVLITLGAAKDMLIFRVFEVAL